MVREKTTTHTQKTQIARYISNVANYGEIDYYYYFSTQLLSSRGGFQVTCNIGKVCLSDCVFCNEVVDDTDHIFLFDGIHRQLYAVLYGQQLLWRK